MARATWAAAALWLSLLSDWCLGRAAALEKGSRDGAETEAPAQPAVVRVCGVRGA